MNRPALCSALLAAGLLLGGTPALGQTLFKGNKSQPSSNSWPSPSPNDRPSSKPWMGTPSRSSGSKDTSRYDNGKAINQPVISSRSSAHTPKNKVADPPVSKTKTADSLATKTKAKDADSPAAKKEKTADAHTTTAKNADAPAKHKKDKNTGLRLADGKRSKILLGQSSKDQLVKGSHENYPSKRPGDSAMLLKAANGSRLSQSEMDRLIDIRNDPKVSSKTRGAIDLAIIQNQKQALLQSAAGTATTGGTPVVSGIPAGNQGNLKPFLGGMVVGSILQGFMNSSLLSGVVPGGAGLQGPGMVDQAGGLDSGGFDPVLLPPSAPGEEEPEEP